MGDYLGCAEQLAGGSSAVPRMPSAPYPKDKVRVRSCPVAVSVTVKRVSRRSGRSKVKGSKSGALARASNVHNTPTVAVAGGAGVLANSSARQKKLCRYSPSKKNNIRVLFPRILCFFSGKYRESLQAHYHELDPILSHFPSPPALHTIFDLRSGKGD